MIGNILKGCRVLDLTQNVAGPYCTRILGDFGADVIKVERPGSGDDTRNWRPPEIHGQSSTFLALNHNKRSIAIDIDQSDGQALIRELAANADIVVHSLKPGSMERRGLGFEHLHAHNPNLIYCAISAFGQTGDMASLPGYDPLLQAYTGVMSVTGAAGGDPVRVGVSLIDMGTGMWAALGIMAAMLRRATTGVGGLVEASLLETGMAWMTVPAAAYLATGVAPGRMGSAMAMSAPYELFLSSDGQVFIGAGNDNLFRAVCEGLDCLHLLNDERFSSNPERVRNRDALHAALETVTRTLPGEEVVARLRRSGAPCSMLRTIAESLPDPQVDQTGIIVAMPLENAPNFRVIGLPVTLDRGRMAAVSPPPSLGADTHVVLSALGKSPDAIERLMAAGVIG